MSLPLFLLKYLVYCDGLPFLIFEKILISGRQRRKAMPSAAKSMTVKTTSTQSTPSGGSASIPIADGDSGGTASVLRKIHALLSPIGGGSSAVEEALEDSEFEPPKKRQVVEWIGEEEAPAPRPSTAPDTVPWPRAPQAPQAPRGRDQSLTPWAPLSKRCASIKKVMSKSNYEAGSLPVCLERLAEDILRRSIKKDDIVIEESGGLCRMLLKELDLVAWLKDKLKKSLFLSKSLPKIS